MEQTRPQNEMNKKNKEKIIKNKFYFHLLCKRGGGEADGEENNRTFTKISRFHKKKTIKECSQ
jgi:hypothetical protein